jgi:hypothetical protein
MFWLIGSLGSGEIDVYLDQFGVKQHWRWDLVNCSAKPLTSR